MRAGQPAAVTPGFETIVLVGQKERDDLIGIAHRTRLRRVRHTGAVDGWFRRRRIGARKERKHTHRRKSGDQDASRGRHVKIQDQGVTSTTLRITELLVSQM
jgi:hypothetical protein